MMKNKTTPEIDTRIAELGALATERRAGNDRDRALGRELRALGVSFYRLASITGLTPEGARKRYGQLSMGGDRS